jgi:hypothetical protein
MSKIAVLRKLAPLAAAATLLVGFTAGASAYQCKAQPEIVAAPGVNQGTAIATGRSMWTASVRSKHGLEWSVWSIASNPTQNCAPVPGGVQCVITAKPCKYVVG